jgi:MFS family permease
LVNLTLPSARLSWQLGFLVALMGLSVTLACVNLAMLMARGANRRKELAVRLAVGASRFRLVRQMTSEGILLSLLGGVAGFAFACGLGVLNSHFRPPTILPDETNFSLDWRAGVFAFGLAIVCGIGFSLVPALQATKTDLTPALKEGSALQLPGYRRIGLRNLLMVAQVAASLMLLLMTGFLVLGISKASSVDPKFDPNTMLLLSLDPVRDGYAPEKAQALFEKLPEQLKTAGLLRSIALAAPALYERRGTHPIVCRRVAGFLAGTEARARGNCGRGLFCRAQRTDAGWPRVRGTRSTKLQRRIESLARRAE